MTPILGILASGMSGNLWAPGKDYDSIATVSVGAGGSSTISFTSIPGTYRHLQLRILSQTNNTAQFSGIVTQFNSDSTLANYYRHDLYGNGTSPGASAAQQRPLIYSGAGPQFGVGVVDILDYANTNKYKTVRGISGTDQNGAGLVALESGLWQNTGAITRIDLTPDSGTAFIQYSHFALYGVK